MATYQHILAGLDLSKDSQDVLQKAYDLALTHNAKLSIMHVVEPFPVTYGGDMPVDLSSAQEAVLQQSRNQLGVLAERYSIDSEQCFICFGETATQLHEQATTLNADLIIVGSHGRHGLALLWGSTARSVLKGAQCDVLAVRV